MLAIEWKSETLELFPQRAIHWPRMRTLIVADMHFAKAASFRAAGVPVPPGTTNEMLSRLDELLRKTHAERLVVLGDLIHAPAGRDHPAMDLVTRWRTRNAILTIDLVRGNHDRSAGDPPSDWNITCHDEPHVDGPFVFRHAPIESDDVAPMLAGHVHPVMTLRDAVGGGLRCRCFVFGERMSLLPAFGAFTGGKLIEPKATDRVFIIGPDDVVELPRRNSAPGASEAGRVTRGAAGRG